MRTLLAKPLKPLETPQAPYDWVHCGDSEVSHTIIELERNEMLIIPRLLGPKLLGHTKSYPPRNLATFRTLIRARLETGTAYVYTREDQKAWRWSVWHPDLVDGCKCEVSLLTGFNRWIFAPSADAQPAAK
jgi:hypothetical protein